MGISNRNLQWKSAMRVSLAAEENFLHSSNFKGTSWRAAKNFALSCRPDTKRQKVEREKKVQQRKATLFACAPPMPTAGCTQVENSKIQVSLLSVFNEERSHARFFIFLSFFTFVSTIFFFQPAVCVHKTFFVLMCVQYTVYAFNERRTSFCISSHSWTIHELGNNLNSFCQTNFAANFGNRLFSFESMEFNCD